MSICLVIQTDLEKLWRVKICQGKVKWTLLSCNFLNEMNGRRERTCRPLEERFPTDVASVRKPRRTTPVSPNSSHDHTLILHRERREENGSSYDILTRIWMFACSRRDGKAFRTCVLGLLSRSGPQTSVCFWTQTLKGSIAATNDFVRQIHELWVKAFSWDLWLFFFSPDSNLRIFSFQTHRRVSAGFFYPYAKRTLAVLIFPLWLGGDVVLF